MQAKLYMPIEVIFEIGITPLFVSRKLVLLGDLITKTGEIKVEQKHQPVAAWLTKPAWALENAFEIVPSCNTDNEMINGRLFGLAIHHRQSQWW